MDTNKKVAVVVLCLTPSVVALTIGGANLISWGLVLPLAVWAVAEHVFHVPIVKWVKPVWLEVQLYRHPSAFTWLSASVARRQAFVHTRPVKDFMVNWVADDPAETVRALAADASKNPRLLARLALVGDGMLCSIVARNSHTPPSVLVDLSKTQDLLVKREVLANRSCPPEVLYQCVQDSTADAKSLSYVDHCLASAVANPNVPQEALCHLAVFGPPLVYRNVAVFEALTENPSCPSWLMAVFSDALVNQFDYQNNGSNQSNNTGQNNDPGQTVLSRFLSGEALEVALGLRRDWSGSLDSLLQTAQTVSSTN